MRASLLIGCFTDVRGLPYFTKNAEEPIAREYLRRAYSSNAF
jgi:hypothetical protein